MFSDLNKRNYLHILETLNKLNANIFTQKELSEHLDVSVRKVSDFQNGKVIDFPLLTQYAGMLGMNIKFYLEQ